jgi:hypothetical protein
MLGQYYKEKLNLTNKTAFKEKDKASLSVFISQSSFIFVITNQNFGVIHQLCQIELINLPGGGNLTEKIGFLINNYQLTQKKFEKIIISILSKDFTIVPESYSDAIEIKELLTFSTGLSEIKNPHFHTINNINFCYSFDQELIQNLEKTFAQAIIKHSGAINIELLFSNHSLINCDLFLIINDGLIEIAAKSNNNLLFFNVFSFENNEDVLYYLLFMMEQFSLNPLSTRLLIGGQVQTNDSLIISIKKYIKHVEFVVHNSNLKLEGELNKLPQHFYFTLLNQYLCV